MKRANWVRLIAMILVISMLAAPVSAATFGGSGHSTHGLIGAIIGIIKDIIIEIIDDWFDIPGVGDPDPTEPPVPTTPEEPTAPSEPVVTDPTEPEVTEPEETEPEVTEPEAPVFEQTLVEGHANTVNGNLLRGVTYTLTQLVAQEPQTAPYALRSTGYALNAVAEETTTYERVDITFDENNNAIIPDGDYLVRFVSDQYSSYMTKDTISSSPWNTNALRGTIDQSAATLFTFTRQTDGTYTIQGPGKWYVVLPRENAGKMQADPNYMNITKAADGTSILIEQVNSNLNLTSLGANFHFDRGAYYFGGYNEDAPFELYRIAEAEPVEPEQPETPVELIYYPVTMFNYDMNTMNEMTLSMYEKGSTLYSGIHFSNGSPGGNVTYAETAHTGEYTNGQYVIQNYRMKDISQPSWLNFSLDGDKGIIAKADQADAAIWTLTRVPGANNFTLTTELDGTTYYMTLGNETSGVTTEYSEITLVYYTHTNAGIQITKDGYYLGHSVDNLFCGNTDSTSTSNGMGFFPVAADGTIGDTARNVTTINGAVTSGFSRWNWWSYLEAKNAAQNKFFAELVQHELDENGDIVFNVIEPGIFKTGTGENIAQKAVYTNVGLPFVKNDKGYYTFDSDAHGTYFADTDGDGKSNPWYGASDDYFNMFFDYQNTQGWADKSNPDSHLGYGDQSKNLWAPFNTNANDTGADAIDYHFGMRADIPFSMTPNGCIKSTDNNSDHITFTFAGDDDVWIFIDGHLVIDLGGIHNRIGATIDFAANTITYFLPESNKSTAELGCYNDRTRYPVVVDENGKQTITVKLYNEGNTEGALGQTRTVFASQEEHKMSIFYMERGKGTSNCKIEFNMPMRDTLLVTKVANKSWSQAADDADEDFHDGTSPLTAKEQAAVDQINFGFTLFKQVAGSTEPTVVANTNYYLVDVNGNVMHDENGSPLIGSTNENGHFTLKNGQTAKFMTDISSNGVTYYVVEDAVPEGFLTPDFQFAGKATKGFEWYDDEGNKHDRISDASSIPEQEIPIPVLQEDGTLLWPEENKSYAVTAYGSIEATDSLQFICINYLNADLPNPTALAMEDTIVIDYGLPVHIDPLANDVFRGDNIEIIAWGDENLTLSKTEGTDGFLESYEITNGVMVGQENQTYQPTFHSGTVQFIDKNYDDTDRANVVRDTFDYTLNKQLTEVEVISYVIKVSSTTHTEVGDDQILTNTEYDVALAKVYIVPATIMYYEEDFTGLIQVLNSTGENKDPVVNREFWNPYQEPGVVGTVNDSTYGTDVAYLHDSEDSNGTSLEFDTTKGYVRFQYTFTGTGTTFFARTGADTGYMQVLLFKDVMEPDENGNVSHYSGKQMATYYRDTYFEDTEKLLPEEGDTLYNIPVYTVDGLTYGTYTVLVTVAKAGTPGAGPGTPTTNAKKHNCFNNNGESIVVEANTPDHVCRNNEGAVLYTKGSGNKFYLDGVRIMQPLNEESREDLVVRALDAYDIDFETNLDVITLRQKLITDVEDGEVNWDGIHYVMLTDTIGTVVKPEDYIDCGPKEEVYLAPGQTVTFSLKYWHPEGLKLYMGMKAPFGGASLNVGKAPYPLNNTVDSYFDVTQDYASLITDKETVTDTYGNPMYYDADGKFYIKVKDANGNYYFCDEEYEKVTVDENNLTLLEREYNIVTYTFTATDSIVSLTNIKVVGSYEFTIVPGYDIHIPGSEGGATENGGNGEGTPDEGTPNREEGQP